MKKHVKNLLLVILVIAMITVPLVGCVEKTTTEPENVSSLKAGTYTGVGKGKNGDVKVEVTFDDSKITEIKVVEHQETEGIAETPIERIPEEIINNQNVAVDGISGATMTSDAIIEAVKDCIVQANGNVDDFTKVVEKPTDAEEEVYDTQLAVVGAGASGLMAAMYASEQGVDVIVLEKAATIGSSNGAVAGGPATSSNRVQEAEEGWAYKADTLEELAEYFGLENLPETVAEYNAMADAGVDTTFGKSSVFLTKIDQGPYYVFQYQSSAWGTLGGVKVDDKLRVINADFEPIEGLYAAGVDAGSLFTTPYYGNEGAAFGMSLGSGSVAGTEIAKYIKSLNNN